MRPSGARRLPPVDTPPEATRPTPHGPVQGYRSGDIYQFKGIPYGADTAGPNRFLPPRRPEGWSRPRLAINYGPACPQPRVATDNQFLRFVGFADDRIQSEDCLNLNIWTPAVDPGAR
ncbi:MAG TPA: carboxylesterase family protein, partial [Novosphingobium sp.]|nr:carboxylesterase family protein [Novosphingobium sp.]